MILAMTLGVVLAFARTTVPTNLSTPQVPTFALHGFRLSADGSETDADYPMYLSETDETRAAALIRFTAPVDGLCSAYELSTQENDGTIHRMGPLHIEDDASGENIVPAKAGLEIKAMLVFMDADDIAQRDFPLDALHRTIGVECVQGSDGKVVYSELYEVRPAPFAAVKT